MKKLYITSIRDRFIFWTVPVLLVALGLVVIVLSWFSDRTLQEGTARQVRQAGKSIAMTIQGNLEEKARVVKTLSASLQALRSEGYRDRTFIGSLLALVHRQNPDLYTVWAMYDRNQWDGRDAFFANKNGWDAQGSFGYYTSMDGQDIKIIQDNDFYEQPYFVEPQKAGTLLLMEPYADEVDGAQITNTSIALPLYDEKKTFLGVCGVDTSLDMIIQQVRQFKYGTSGYALLISGNGTVLSDQNEAKIGKVYTEVFSKELASAIQEHLTNGSESKETNKIDTWYNLDNRAYYTLFFPIELKGGSGRWLCAVMAPKDELLAPIYFFRSISIGGALITFMFTLLVIFIIATQTVQPLKLFESLLEPVGKGDFTVRFQGFSNDEIGELGKTIDDLLEKLSILIHRIKAAAAALASLEDLSNQQTEQTGLDVEQIAEAIASMQQALYDQVSMVNQVTGFMQENLFTVSSLDTNIERQSKRLQESSAAVEEMTANVGSIAGNMEGVSSSVMDLKTASDRGLERLNTVSALVTDVSGKSQALLEVNSTISGIAGRTNLLAMNAAIEAAHAGEAGKGFAVVADEIRNLAENSAVKSKESGRVLKSVQSAIETMVSAITAVEASFKDIMDKVNQVESLSLQVKTSLEEQKQGSEQVLETLAQLHKITAEVRSQSAALHQQNTSVLEQAKLLSSRSEELKTKMNKIDEHGHHIRASVHKMVDLAQSNREELAVLIRETSAFKIRL
uniref:Methyl-accepting chemotaxis protein n=1 Tax=Gracilinema caldarium TaxID=215591 RepID=A0A7C3EGY4_9SPIR